MKAKGAQELRDLVRIWDEATSTSTEEEIEGISVARRAIGRSMPFILPKERFAPVILTNLEGGGRLGLETLLNQISDTKQRGHYDSGRQFTNEYRWTDIFVKRQGRWQCIAAQVASIPPPKTK